MRFHPFMCNSGNSCHHTLIILLTASHPNPGGKECQSADVWQFRFGAQLLNLIKLHYVYYDTNSSARAADNSLHSCQDADSYSLTLSFFFNFTSSACETRPEDDIYEQATGSVRTTGQQTLIFIRLKK